MRIKSIGVALFQDGMILLVKAGPASKHLNNTYGFPAGRWEEGETEKHTGVRELKEETGLDANEEDLIEFPGNCVESTLQMKNGPEDHAFRVFIVKKYSGQLVSSDETIPEWVDLNKLSQFNLLPNVKLLIDKALNYLRR